MRPLGTHRSIVDSLTSRPTTNVLVSDRRRAPQECRCRALSEALSFVTVPDYVLVVEREVLEASGPSGEVLSAELVIECDEEAVSLYLGLSDGMEFGVSGSPDLEDALVLLRQQLDRDGRRLHCNRFRRNALVSGMSRSMSGGEVCYLVRSWRPILPGRDLVPALGRSPMSQVVTTSENQRYLDRWNRRVALLAPLSRPVLAVLSLLDRRQV